jgi:N-acyl-D-aspartate/D-glutamate deacylase
VGERHLLTLEQAVHKMTALPASRMQLTGRGLLAEGNAADINLFDPAVFRDNATFEEPTRPASGLACCIVNGRIALRDGRVLRRDSGVLLSAGA